MVTKEVEEKYLVTVPATTTIDGKSVVAERQEERTRLAFASVVEDYPFHGLAFEVVRWHRSNDRSGTDPTEK